MKYNKDLKEEPVNALGALTCGALTQQRQAIRQQLNKDKGRTEEKLERNNITKCSKK